MLEMVMLHHYIVTALVKSDLTYSSTGTLKRFKFIVVSCKQNRHGLKPFLVFSNAGV